MISCKNNNMLIQAREARFQPKPIIQIIVFLAVFGVSNIIAGLLMIAPMIIGISKDKEFIGALASDDIGSAISLAISIVERPWVVLVSLFVTVAITLSCVVYCCKIERRSLASMGFKRQGWLKRYLKGYAIGTVMLLLCALILWLMGDLDFAFAEKIPVLYLLVFFVGFVIQGMSEEVLLRGYFMVSLNNSCHTAIAVGISSVTFAILHLSNPGISLLALLNITLFGIFMAVYVLRTDDLLGACAIHSAWNFAQGNLIGVRVSGMGHLPTVAVMNPLGNQSLFHGGDFGLEGGLIVTFVTLGAIVLTLFLPQKKQKTSLASQS